MSTRCNIVLNDGYQKLWFYRHSDGYPEGAMPLIAEFVGYVNEEKIRSNVSQAGGWLIALGMREYDVTLPPTGEPRGWKVGAIEPTKGRHGDIEYLYTITLNEHRLEYGTASVECHTSDGEKIDISEFLKKPEEVEAVATE